MNISIILVRRIANKNTRINIRKNTNIPYIHISISINIGVSMNICIRINTTLNMNDYSKS